jgi:N-acetylmuramoyl-L-alanine amidase
VQKIFEPDASLVSAVAASPNFDARQGGAPDMILLHYTGMASAAAALARLIDPTAKVSSHYFVHEDGRVLQLVAEAWRAWHAGDALWDGESDINSRSIGVEIVNPGHDFGYPDFPRTQIKAVIALCRDIREEAFAPTALAHSDVSPCASRIRARNSLGLLHKKGGHLAPRGSPKARRLPGDRGEAVTMLRHALAAAYGPPTGEFDATTGCRRGSAPLPSRVTAPPSLHGATGATLWPAPDLGP